MSKLHELHFKVLLHPPYSPDLAPKWLPAVCRPQKNAPGKEIGFSQVISETEVYFEVKDTSSCKKDIEFLEKHWKQCITLQRDYVDE